MGSTHSNYMKLILASYSGPSVLSHGGRLFFADFDFSNINPKVRLMMSLSADGNARKESDPALKQMAQQAADEFTSSTSKQFIKMFAQMGPAAINEFFIFADKASGGKKGILGGKSPVDSLNDVIEDILGESMDSNIPPGPNCDCLACQAKKAAMVLGDSIGWSANSPKSAGAALSSSSINGLKSRAPQGSLASDLRRDISEIRDTVSLLAKSINSVIDTNVALSSKVAEQIKEIQEKLDGTAPDKAVDESASVPEQVSDQGGLVDA